MGKSANGSKPAGGGGGGRGSGRGRDGGCNLQVRHWDLVAGRCGTTLSSRALWQQHLSWWSCLSSLLSAPPPGGKSQKGGSRRAPPALKDLVNRCSPPVGMGKDGRVGIKEMFTGGSGS
jgi:hypothetical protein